MSIPLIIVGAGGFGRETLDVVMAINQAAATRVFDVLGVVDTKPRVEDLSRLAARGIRWLGTEAEWLASENRAQYIIGIGNPDTRERVDQAFRSAELVAATAIHPAATIGTIAAVSEGSVICAGAQISTNVSLGRHVHINPNATIGHDSILRDFVSVNPAATISGHVIVREKALVGAGSVILQGLIVGARSTIGASACVTRNVEVGATVKGIPAQ